MIEIPIIMESFSQKPTSVSEYIARLDVPAKSKIQELRALLKEVAPHAEESLKWGKPVFESDTILFAYSAHRSFLSFVPTGPSLSPFLEMLSGYVIKKDSVQFPYNQNLPLELIKKIAAYRVWDVDKNNAKWKY